MDEGAQLGSGMYGPLIVLEAGAKYDPARDITFIVGGVVDGDSLQSGLNGSTKPGERTLQVGVTYRLRFINILSAEPVRIELLSDTTLLNWRSLAKDGADLPPAAQQSRPSRLYPLGVGETYDFEFTPAKRGVARLEVRYGPVFGTPTVQTLRIR